MNLKFNSVAILILLESFLQLIEDNILYHYTNLSQSLFYWNPFCNKLGNLIGLLTNDVAILILLESFLQ